MIGYLNGTFERLFMMKILNLPLVLISGSELIYGALSALRIYPER